MPWSASHPIRVGLIYLGFGNYPTLGYADLVAPVEWRLLRPMTALNGIMLIGWSTALIIEILRRSGPQLGRLPADNASPLPPIRKQAPPDRSKTTAEIEG